MTYTSQHIERSRNLWLAALLAVATPGGSRAAEAPAAQAASTPVQTVELVYHEAQSSFVNWSLNATRESTPFAKEPATAGSEVLRGKITLGGQATNAVAFVWDRKAGKLFLDLNRNLDLTDDADGVFSTRKEAGGAYQSFTNVHLRLKTPLGQRQVAGELALWDFSRRVRGSFAVRSLGRGRMTCQGEEWEVGLIENVSELGSPESGFLLLRPWAKREERVSVYDGSLQAVRFARRLFLNGQAWQLALTNGPAGDASPLRLHFTEEHPPLGEIKLTGKFIQRLVLEGGYYLVVLDKPETVVRLPVGSYAEPQVWLQSGGAGASANLREASAARPLTVDAKTPALLNAGGPLTNSVSVSRRRSRLHLSYELVGPGGRTYTRGDPNGSTPPEFVVYRAGRKVGAGKFEFG